MLQQKIDQGVKINFSNELEVPHVSLLELKVNMDKDSPLSSHNITQLWGMLFIFSVYPWWIENYRSSASSHKAKNPKVTMPS